jgi:hypothetical protein
MCPFCHVWSNKERTVSIRLWLEWLNTTSFWRVQSICRAIVWTMIVSLSILVLVLNNMYLHMLLLLCVRLYGWNYFNMAEQHSCPTRKACASGAQNRGFDPDLGWIVLTFIDCRFCFFSSSLLSRAASCQISRFSLLFPFAKISFSTIQGKLSYYIIQWLTKWRMNCRSTEPGKLVLIAKKSVSIRSLSLKTFISKSSMAIKKFLNWNASRLRSWSADQFQTWRSIPI